MHPLTPFHSTPSFSFASSTYFHTLTTPSITYLASNSAILCLSTTDEAPGRYVFSICPLLFFLVLYSPFCLSSCLLKKYHENLRRRYFQNRCRNGSFCYPAYETDDQYCFSYHSTQNTVGLKFDEQRVLSTEGCNSKFMKCLARLERCELCGKVVSHLWVIMKYVFFFGNQIGLNSIVNLSSPNCSWCKNHESSLPRSCSAWLSRCLYLRPSRSEDARLWWLGHGGGTADRRRRTERASSGC